MDFSVLSTTDPHSYTEPEEARVKHIDLELNVDFYEKVLKGKAILTIERKPSVNQIILDRLGLVVLNVTDIDDKPLDCHDIDVDIAALGNPINVQLPQAVDIIYNSEYKIQIEYKTISTSPALHWLTPAQTADNLHSFLLSNNKLMYARAWFPCQDTPSVKFTYTAKISVPKTFTVLMSALLQDVRVDVCRPERDVYEFCQDKSVPSYAVIIAVGALEKIELNARTSLYAEKTYSTSARHTFHSGINTIECMLEDAKSLCGPYFWGRYDICVLPPSIAHFEIECPCVMFISPILLPGDYSYISLLAQRISESWAGCLVTCSNYEHLWLNKSFSIFISRKIISKLLIQIEDMNSFLKRKGLYNLRYKIQKSTNFTWPKCLLPNLKGLFPVIEATEYVPYESGCIVLEKLENMLGGPSVFEPFFKSYFNEFAFKSINTQEWKDYLYQYFRLKKKTLDDVAWDVWFFDDPPPPTMPEKTTWETKYCELAKEWVNWDCQTDNIPDALRNRNINLHMERILFLNYLHDFHEKLTRKKLICILEHYKFEEYYEHNTKIRFFWLLLCIKVRWAKKVDSALNFAIEYCSPFIACPIFKRVYEWEGMRRKAIETYKSNKGKMLYETQKELDEILHLKS
ncbi:leukotriene A-4 hydrolase-like [Temnothorax nylanderi]|uniref:leukotriene A-4 hydrolase-like n=1 Tax=Temnothorax nylanderi TaxID=102681 RepID=UPI003A893716